MITPPNLKQQTSGIVNVSFTLPLIIETRKACYCFYFFGVWVFL